MHGRDEAANGVGVYWRGAEENWNHVLPERFPIGGKA